MTIRLICTRTLDLQLPFYLCFRKSRDVVGYDLVSIIIVLNLIDSVLSLIPYASAIMYVFTQCISNSFVCIRHY